MQCGGKSWNITHDFTYCNYRYFRVFFISRIPTHQQIHRGLYIYIYIYIYILRRIIYNEHKHTRTLKNAILHPVYPYHGENREVFPERDLTFRTFLFQLCVLSVHHSQCTVGGVWQVFTVQLPKQQRHLGRSGRRAACLHLEGRPLVLYDVINTTR